MNNREGDEEVPQSSVNSLVKKTISPNLKFITSYIFNGKSLLSNHKQSTLKFMNNFINQVNILINCLCLSLKKIKI